MKGIELFAGFGGGVVGTLQAGVKMLVAANHWPLAIHWHKLNHPWILHLCEDLRQYDYGLLPDHDLAITTPCCQGHSRGRRRNDPKHDASRATAWSVVSLIEAKRPEVVIIENVPEFQNWVLFPAFKAAIEALRYSLSINVVDCADLGLPQNRVRLVMVATKSKTPFVLDLPKREHVGIETVIDWDRYRWSKVDRKGRSPKTIARVERGRGEIGSTFVMPYYSNGSGLTGRSLKRPIGTLTTRARWAVVDGDRMRMLQIQEARAAMGFPIDYQLPTNQKLANHLLGNAIPPVLARETIQALIKAA